MQKFFILFLVSFFCFTTAIIAQITKEGVYLSYNDFLDGKISYQKIQGKKYKLKLNTVFNTSFISITIGNSKFRLKKDSVFGYRDKTNTAYRFYKNLNYRILDPDETILLYAYSSLGGSKNTEVVTDYFFSIGPDCPLIKLTKQNLKAVFITEPAFIDLIDVYFKSDDELLNYDESHKTYLLNSLLQTTQNTNFKKENRS